MSRSLPSAITTELAKDSITYVDLIELHFDSDLKTLTNGPKKIVGEYQIIPSHTLSHKGLFLIF